MLYKILLDLTLRRK